METKSAYEVMVENAQLGHISAFVPATNGAGDPILWMTSAEYLGSGTDQVRSLVAAVAITRRAYREAHKHGVDTLI